MKNYWVVFLLLSTPVLAVKQPVGVSFYNKTYSIFFDTSVLNTLKFSPGEGFFEKYYNHVENEIITEDLQASLDQIQRQDRLNDWLYYQLLHKTLRAILPKAKKHEITLLEWYLLCKKGFDVRIEFQLKNITLSVFTKDLVYGLQQAKRKGGYYVDITSHHNGIDYLKFSPMRVKWKPDKEVRTFSFALISIPNIFDALDFEKTLRFEHNGTRHMVNVKLNKGYVRFLRSYPEVSLNLHAQTPLSEVAYNSLMPYLKKEIAEMDTAQATRFLLSFTRTAFAMVHEEALKKSELKIFAPEECLFYPVSEPEDRSVLFTYLARQLLELDVLMLKFSKITMAAVNLSDSIGVKPIMHNDEFFTLCDPTDPQNKLELGEYPEGYLRKTPKLYLK